MKSNPQVLLIDRNVSDVKVVRDTLGSAGLEIHVRASASAALVAFHALEPDLVIVDSDVPGTSGAAVTREIKNTERGRATPVILIAEGPLEESQRAQTLTTSGCTMVLQKPLMPQDLIDTMTRFLPNAFIGQDKPAAPAAPKSTAPRRAAGVMRDPGTPFTADSFDDDSLRALLDQVFPTSDSGSLAQTIRTRGGAGTEKRSEDAASSAAAKTPTVAPNAAHAPSASEPPSAVPAAPPATPAPPSARSAASSPSPATRPTPAEPPAGTPSGPAAAARASRTGVEDTGDFVVQYLAQGQDDGDGDDTGPTTGLSVKDAEALDRIFDGPDTKPVMADDLEIEPLAIPDNRTMKTAAPAPTEPPRPTEASAASTTGAKAAAGPAAKPATSIPAAASEKPSFEYRDEAAEAEAEATESASASVPSSSPLPAMPSSSASEPFIDDSFGGLDFDEPAEPANVWGELEAALPPALASSAPSAPADAEPSTHAKPVPPAPSAVKQDAPKQESAKTASVKPEPAMPEPPKAQTAKPAMAASTTTASLPPAKTPQEPPVPPSKPAATLPTTSYARAVSETTTHPTSSKASIPLSPKPPSRGSEPAGAPAPESAAKPPAAPPVETIPLARESDAKSPEPSSETRRSKKNKKSKGRRQEGPESIPLAAKDSGTAMMPSAAESRAASSTVTASEPVPFHAETTADMLPVAAAAPKRRGLIVIAAGVALAAAVGAFYVMTRSGDSDLRPTDPDRQHTPASHESIKNEGAASPETPAEPDSRPPVIPETTAPSDAESAPAAGDPSGRSNPEAEPPAPGAETGTAPSAHGSSPATGPAEPRAGTESARPTKPAVVTPKATPTSGSATPSTHAASAAPNAARPAPPVAPAGTASSESRPSRSPGQARRDSTPPPAAEPASGAPAAPSGPPAAALDSPESGTTQPPADAPAQAGQVALGATMPSSESIPGAGEAEGESVKPLMSPIPISRPAPVYPPAALAMRATGTVGLLVKVEADGHVSDVKIVRPASPSLNASAVAAARQWRYRPAHRGMDTVATWIEENVVFRLK